MADVHGSEGPDGMSGAGLPDAFGLLARWNYSLAAFYVRRWQRQVELPLKLARTASPGDLMELRQAFEADLIADYRDQAVALHHHCADHSEAADRTSFDYAGELLRAQADARALIDQAKAHAERIVANAEARAGEILAKAQTAPDVRRAAG